MLLTVTNHNDAEATGHGTSDTRVLYAYEGVNPYLSSAWPIVVARDGIVVKDVGVLADVAVAAAPGPADLEYVLINGLHVYQYSLDSSGSEATGVGEYWPVLDVNGANLTSVCSSGSRRSRNRRNRRLRRPEVPSVFYGGRPFIGRFYHDHGHVVQSRQLHYNPERHERHERHERRLLGDLWVDPEKAPVSSIDDILLPRPDRTDRPDRRRLVTESEIDTSRCGNETEQFIATMELHTTDPAVFEAILATAQAQHHADETGSTGEFDELGGDGSTALSGITELSSDASASVYLCGPLTIRAAHEIITLAPSTPPSAPPPSAPTLEIDIGDLNPGAYGSLEQLLFSSALDDDAQPSTFPTPLTDTPLLKNYAFLTTLTLPALDSRFVTKCYVLRNYASGRCDGEIHVPRYTRHILHRRLFGHQREQRRHCRLGAGRPCAHNLRRRR